MSVKVRLSVLEERSKSERQVRKAQAKEYERRLTDLNHAHDKQVQDQRTYVSMDKFDGFTTEMGQFRTAVNKQLAELDGRAGGAGSARSTIFQILPLIISVVALIGFFWKAS